MKCKGKPKTNHNPGWKARVQAERKLQAEARQVEYEARPLAEKLQRAGAKERAKLMEAV